MSKFTTTRYAVTVRRPIKFGTASQLEEHYCYYNDNKELFSKHYKSCLVRALRKYFLNKNAVQQYYINSYDFTVTREELKTIVNLKYTSLLNNYSLYKQYLLDNYTDTEFWNTLTNQASKELVINKLSF